MIIAMCAEQFDENKESVYGVCSTGGGYGWGTILYDSETGKWYEHLYHCGSVDICEDHDDGISEIDDIKYVIVQLIEKNELHNLLKYYRELDAENNLCEALEGLQKTHGGFLRQSRWLESPYHTYFRFENGDYSVWFSDVFYSADDSGECKTDYYTVDRILKEKNTVRIFKFNFRNKKWTETDWDGIVYSETDQTEYPKTDDKKNKLPQDTVSDDPSYAAAADKGNCSLPVDETGTEPPAKTNKNKNKNKKKSLFAKLFRK